MMSLPSGDHYVLVVAVAVVACVQRCRFFLSVWVSGSTYPTYPTPTSTSTSTSISTSISISSSTRTGPRPKAFLSFGGGLSPTFSLLIYRTSPVA